jgi:hypothetical protein
MAVEQVKMIFGRGGGGLVASWGEKYRYCGREESNVASV